MSTYKLSADQIKTNYDKFINRIKKFFPTRSEQLLQMYAELGEERLMFLPASGTDSYHNAIPGGYIDHVLRVMDFALLEYKHYENMGLDVSNFTIEELMFAALNHDLGKVGLVGPGKEGYIYNQSEWHRKNQGKLYSPNDQLPFALVPDRSIFLLQQYGVQMSWNEFLAIRIHDGLYDKANEAYYISYQTSSKLRTNMAIILHNADMAAARFEFEQWNMTTNALNTTRIEDVIIQPVIKKDKTTKPNVESLAKAFNDIFSTEIN